jgi:hypothetical protein
MKTKNEDGKKKTMRIGSNYLSQELGKARWRYLIQQYPQPHQLSGRLLKQGQLGN